jgi:hypothetical protein
LLRESLVEPKLGKVYDARARNPNQAEPGDIIKKAIG